MRAEDAQGTPTPSHISASILIFADNPGRLGTRNAPVRSRWLAVSEHGCLSRNKLRFANPSLFTPQDYLNRDSFRIRRVRDNPNVSGLWIRAGRVSSSLLGPVVPSFRALSSRLKFTARRYEFNEDSVSSGRSVWFRIQGS